MRILFITSSCPLPADTGGKIRTLNILKQLIKRHSVHLVCFAIGENDREMGEQLEKMGMDITLIPPKKTSLPRMFFTVLAHPLPYTMTKYNSVDMRSCLMGIKEREKFDLVYFDHLHTTHYIDIFEGIPCFLDEHNVEYRILERCAETEKNPIKKLGFRQQAGKLRKFETDRLGLFSACSAVSSEDAILLKKLGTKTPVHIVTNGVDTEFFYSADNEEEPGSLVFTGSMDWLPNDDAMKFFTSNVMPLIWKKTPGINLYIVGRNPSRDLKSLASREPRIKVTGKVEDVRSYMDKGSVFVAPLRIGGGTRLKILEALSMRKAVVATTIGAEGIEYSPGKNIEVADTPEKISESIIKLLNHPEIRRELGEAGRKLVLEKYDWNIVGENLNRIFEETKNS